ncbi:MAG: Unknown protein [uncultured Thiotrichaceae bacterium]|uniref:G domain-containing protein n=1 Tax=uncultured Thiotrichaceae bacterium TaxID=298394 RepID=A0A6S6TZ55_9GAMM|nr:MAG: Unknown protein [uncultured Thiotrichaceae bacterium]
MSTLNSLSEAVSDFHDDFKNISADEANLMKVRDDFVEKIKLTVNSQSRLRKENPLSKVTNEVSNKITTMISNWAVDWDASQSSRDLSEAFGDKVVFLVFGKVNAGKSSFSNFIASLFPEQDQRFFRLENGKICDTKDNFSVGVIETTAEIQGIELGGKLILLDSPGLHSVTDENGDLTRRFTDSADAILWLTPSTSPGQVQELDDLKMELESRKPLLPIITRSDTLEEDCDDDGNIVSHIRNKTTENRELQQNDVHTRACSKLGGDDAVRLPLSVSVHSYTHSPQKDIDLKASGLSEVIIGMCDLIHLASQYKPSKARQQIINYLDNSVLKGIEADLMPMVSKLEETIEDQDKAIDACQKEILLSLKSELNKKVLDWAEELKENGDRKTELASRISNFITQRLTKELSNIVEDFTQEVNAVAVSFTNADTGDFNDIFIDYEQVTGTVWKAAGSAGAAAAGAAAGALLGPAGVVGGAILGGLLGGAAGSYMVETETKREKVGIDTNGVVKSTLNSLDKKLPKIIEDVFNVWKEAIGESRKSVSQIRREITNFEQSLKKSKESLINECG